MDVEVLSSPRSIAAGGVRWRETLLLLSLMVMNSVALAADAPPADAVAPANGATAETGQSFDILEYRVIGNTLLPVPEVERTVQRFLGPGKSFTEIDAARGALEQRYRDAGYPFVVVNIPEQQVADGIVRLVVVEGHVEQMRVEGARYFSPEALRAQLSSLRPGEPLQRDTVQQQLGVAGAQYAERTITPLIRPGRTPGTVDVALKVKDRLPLYADVEVNDRDSESSDRWHLSASISYANLWQLGHSLSLQYQTTPEHRQNMEVWSATYIARFIDHTPIYALYGVKTNSNSAAVGDISVIGKGDIAGFRAVIPLVSQQAANHSVSLGFDYKDFAESVVLQGADSLNTPISYLSFAAQYSVSLHADERDTHFELGTNLGVRGLGNTPEEFNDKRYLAKPNYAALRAAFELTQSLWWGTRGRLHIDGQLANMPLISNEQYAAGGVQSVRGYFESQVLGDDGVTATFEWHTPSFAAPLGERVKDLHALLFLDGAAIHTQDALPGTSAHAELTSSGIGLRLAAYETLTATLDWARVFHSAGSIESGDSRWHVRLAYNF